MIVHRFTQYSPEWWEARRGIPTASEFDRILTGKGKLSKACDKYIAELIAARVALDPNAFSDRGRMGTPDMQWGRDNEPEARRFYEMTVQEKVLQVGFITTDDKRFGCSPDGLVGEDGGLELKCPKLSTHAAYLMKYGPTLEVPREYRPQVHGALIVTGRKWWDFLSYAPGLSPHLVRVFPDDYTKALSEALDEFCKKLDDEAAKLIFSEQF